MTWHLGILISHPIQYDSPWFRHLAKRLNIEVFYAHRQDARGQAEAGFGVEFDWDVPLLDGYSYRWLTNVARNARVGSFSRFDTPEIYNILRNERFDAFLVFGWSHKSAIQTVRACWQNDVPVLMRGDSHLLTKRSWAKSTLKYVPYRWFLPRIDGHLYVGKRSKDYLLHYGVPQDRLFFVPHFVDNDFFAKAAQKAEIEGRSLEIRSELGIPQDAFVFLFVGKLIAKKRPADFVQACLEIFGLPGASDVHALFVGDGPLRSSLGLLAEAYAYRIHFAGFRNQTDLGAFYNASNVLVLPSDGGETWGLVVNEAFACGLPAVVSDAVGCGPDMIDEGLSGYTYPVGNVAALARRMLDLKTKVKAKPLAIRQALSEKVARYSMEKATEGLESALEVVTRKSKNPRLVRSLCHITGAFKSSKIKGRIST